MIRPEYQNWNEYTGDSSKGMRYPLVPLWGSKIEVVAPKWHFRTLSQHLNLFGTLIPFCHKSPHLNAGEHLNDISAKQIPLCEKAKVWEKSHLVTDFWKNST